MCWHVYSFQGHNLREGEICLGCDGDSSRGHPWALLPTLGPQWPAVAPGTCGSLPRLSPVSFPCYPRSPEVAAKGPMSLPYSSTWELDGVIKEICIPIGPTGIGSS